jgi:hypothetical protein
MKLFKRFGMLAVATLAIAACEDVTNPLDEGALVGPFVRFVSNAASAKPGTAAVNVVFQLPTRLEEDVLVDYTFGGDAVFGTDYAVVKSKGEAGAKGGTMRIGYDPSKTAIPQDTLVLSVPAGATPGHVLEVNITGAKGAVSGRNVEAGYIDKYRTYKLTVAKP